LKDLVCLGLACVLLCPAPPAAIGAVGLQEDALVRAGFGDRPEEYGSAAMAAAGSIPVIVPAFDVTPDGIFVFDQIQKNVKVYTLAGDYRRTIKLGRLSEATAPLEAGDILVAGGELHLLVDAGQPSGACDAEWSRFRVLSFDVASGAERGLHLVKNPKVGTIVSDRDGSRSHANGTVELSWQGDGVALFDHGQQLSYPVTGPGDDPVDAAGAVPRVGTSIGPHRIRENRGNGTLEVLDDQGQLIRSLPGEGVPIAFASDTEHYAMSRVDSRPGLVVTVHSASGLTMGEAFIPFRGRWENNPPSYWARFELHDGSLYEILVNDDGVHIVRWHTDLALR
jgi:hypothetical protein